MIYPYIQKKEVLKTEKASAYLLAETQNNDIVELEIKENGIVPAHALPINVTFYVVSGKGCITISDKKIEVSKGDVINVNKNMDRAWNNPNPEDLKLLVIKQKK